MTQETWKILVAGFGGQGILFAGKFLVQAGMLQNKNVSWLPSYGPEMRGGTANCSVMISESPVGSPIVTTPNLLLVMNLPSLDKYEAACETGASIIYDSTLITRTVTRADVQSFSIPATALAEERGLKGLANMILVGKTLKEADICPYEEIEAALKKTIPERKKDLLAVNQKAVDIGWNWEVRSGIR